MSRSSQTLEALCRLVEQECSGATCSILFVDEDGKRLRHGAAPSLPTAYTSLLDGWPIGPEQGPLRASPHSARKR